MITTYPRKGTETTAELINRLPNAHYNLSPQGDGNFHAATSRLRASILQLIPARGRKQKFIVSHGIFLHYNLSPQGDGHLRARDQTYRQSKITTYPRKGTETESMTHLMRTHRDYNLSPQGDGNLLSIIFGPPLNNYNLSPQGDGNFWFGVTLTAVFITTYPRKGTVTLFSWEHKTEGPNYNLSPQGDGNKRLITLVSMILLITTYPRKGTVTINAAGCSSRQRNYNLSP